MPSLFDWSTSAGSNTSVDGVSVAEGMSPALVNNAIRAVMSVIRSTFAVAIQPFLAGTDPLPLANGGTAATSASAALTSLGGLASTYRDLPVTAQTGSFAFTDVMRGTLQRFSGGASSLTIEANATTAINTGGVIVVLNKGSGALTTSKAVGVSVYISGQTVSANVVIAVGGKATFTKSDTNEWMVDGTGIS